MIDALPGKAFLSALAVIAVHIDMKDLSTICAN
jgi:hypothetical protein